jgi:hypothetical protein
MLPPASFALGSALCLRSIDAATHLPAALQSDFYHVAWLFSAAAIGCYRQLLGRRRIL